ncbi:ABC transporter substrate-binding protein [Cohnella silvisoli]|uniref:Extracellular solute-binding protein n=1 Tax=Cohnella silvisoli TaxID=2873699 RepID=A0ABV1L3S4_9BACL|nr:extracellular solute-binding protein [Cohnella silvisoli]MCD9026181.1 extracellular solute-binding protein [Cohnella silvisoli]
MQRKRFGMALIGVLLILSLVVAACSKNNTTATNTNGTATEESSPVSTPEPVEEHHDPVTLHLITWNNTYGDLYAKFHERYPWITIEPIIIASAVDKDIIEKITALEAAGTPADLIWLSDLSQYGTGNLLEDLKPYIDSDESLKNVKLPDGFFQSMETDGKQYAVPFVDVPTWVLINKDLMAKYGLEMPGNDWTYDKFREMAKAATDPVAGEYGLTNNALFGIFFLNAMAVANGHAPNLSYMDEKLEQSVLNKPEVLADVTWVQELMTKDGSLPGWVKGAKLGESVNSFMNGKTLFDIGGDWVLEGLRKDAKFEWDVLPYPKGKVSQVTHRIFGPIAMLAGSKNKDAAWKWISFQFETEAQKWKVDHGSNASVISEELTNYISESPMWKGKNTEAVKLTKDMCCIAPGPTIPAFGENPWLTTAAPIFNGTDVNALIAPVEAWNKKTMELRKAAGK